MPHIGIERLCTGHGEKHSAEHQEAMPRVPHQERHPVIRIDGQQDLRLLCDIPDAERRQHRKPDQHDGPEQASDSGRTAPLKQKQHDQQHE